MPNALSPNIRAIWLWLALLLLSAPMTACIAPPVTKVASQLHTLGMNSPAVGEGSTEDPPPLCRMGINVSSFPSDPFYIDDFDLAPLRAGWYVDYRATPSPPANNGAEYAMVMEISDNEQGDYHYSPSGAALEATVAAHPGGIYIVGNEPDRRVLQDDVSPENYAYIYHDAYLEIKSKDPSAQVWAGAIVQPTLLRLQYLDRVLAAYQARYHQLMPVDGWAIHAFILNERSCEAYHNDLNVCWGAEIPPGIEAIDGEIRTPDDNARLDIFTQGIMRFRNWMAHNGYRNTPLHVSEYGVLMPPVFGFPPSKVNTYMSETFDYLLNTKDEALGYPPDDNRLVQRFAWFSTFAPSFNGDLYQSTNPNDAMTGPFVLSEMGKHFQLLAAQETESSDLALLAIHVDEAAHQVVATIGNSGNRLTPTQAVVRFYEGPTFANAHRIGEDVAIGVAGCGVTQQAVTAWDVPDEENPTTYRLWAQISQPDFPDSNPENDLHSQAVFVNGMPMYLPVLKRSLP